MMLFEMMTNKWLNCWRLAKYLKKFTDVQLFPYLLSIQQDAWLFLGDGGWEELDNRRNG